MRTSCAPTFPTEATMLLQSATDVIECLVSRLLTTEGPIAVMAGHFALVPHRETGELVAGVVPDIEHEPTRHWVAEHHYMGAFPIETWRVGIEIVQRLRAAGCDAKLLVLVNDWQHVPPAVSGERSTSRDAFFANATLPPTLKKILADAGLDETTLVTDKRDGKPCIFWAESKLRARYNRHLKVTVPVDSACAQEWVPLLVRLDELGYGGFAAFVPNMCRMPIIGGTERADECLELNLKTVNVFPSGDADDFWSNTWVEP